MTYLSFDQFVNIHYVMPSLLELRL